jgi:hypothetical protein
LKFFSLLTGAFMYEQRPLESLLAIVTAMAIGAVLLASVQQYSKIKANSALRDAGIQNDQQQ